MWRGVAVIPTVITGLLAWQWQLEGHHLKGILLQHLVMAVVSSVLIWVVTWMVVRDARKSIRIPIELLAVIAIAVTAHSGGFLSGAYSMSP